MDVATLPQDTWSVLETALVYIVKGVVAVVSWCITFL